MKSLKFLMCVGLVFFCMCAYSQNNYQLSLGTSIPDNISNKYLKTGIFLGYGINLKLTNHFSINTNISIAFNNKNSSYQFGFNDEPNFDNNPQAVEAYERLKTDPSTRVLYLFNTGIALNLKYNIIPQKKITPYIFTGFSINYSILKDPLDTYEFSEEGELLGIAVYGSESNKFNLGYQTGLGISYFFKNNNTIIVETLYNLQPNVKFGRNQDRIGLFIISAGLSFPFGKKE